MPLIIDETPIRQATIRGDDVAAQQRVQEAEEKKAAELLASQKATEEKVTTTTTEKPDFRPTQTEADREAELRAAAAAAEENYRRALDEANEEAARQIQQSAQDVKAKIAIIDAYKDADEPMPPGAKEAVYGKSSGYLTAQEDGSLSLNLDAAVKGKVPDEDLKKLGISQIDIVNARKAIRQEKIRKDTDKETGKILAADAAAAAAAATLTGKELFDQLVAKGEIPKGSHFDKIDEAGNVIYYPPLAGLEDTKTQFSQLSKDRQQKFIDAALQENVGAKSAVSGNVTPAKLGPGLKATTSIRSWDQLTPDEQEAVLVNYRATQAASQMAKDMSIGFVPVIGTIYTWERTSTPWKVVNIATDVIAIAPMLRLGRLSKQALGMIGKGDDMLKAARATERATLKATSGAETVKAYDELVRASDDFVRNLQTIKTTEKLIDKTAKIPLNAQKGVVRLQEKIQTTLKAMAKPDNPPRIQGKLKDELRAAKSELDNLRQSIQEAGVPDEWRVTLKKAEEINGDLAARVKLAGDKFAKAQAATIKGQKLSPGKGWLDVVGKAGYDEKALEGFGDRTLRDIRTIIDQAYEGKIPNTKQLEKQLQAVRKAQIMAEHDQDWTTVNKLVRDGVDIQSKMKIAQTGELTGLHAELTVINKQIDQLEAILRVGAKAKGDKLRTLTATEKAALADELQELRQLRVTTEKKFVQALGDTEAVWEPHWKGRGKGAPDKPPEWDGPGGGSSRPDPGGYRTTYAKQGAKLVYTDGESEIWSLPGVQTIPGTGKPWITVEPQPTWLLAKAGQSLAKGVVYPQAVKTITKEPLVIPPITPTKEPDKAPGRRIYPEEVPVIVPQPETEPVKRPYHPDKPKPGEITWTPSIVAAPVPQSPTTQTPAPGRRVSPTPGETPGKDAGTGKGTDTGGRTGQGPEGTPGATPGTGATPGAGTSHKPKAVPFTRPGTKTKTEVVTEPEPKGKPRVHVPVHLPTPTTTDTPPVRRPIPIPPHRRGSTSEEWSPVDVRGAVAWRMGFGIWGVRQPYGPTDWKFFMPSQAPAGLHITDKQTAFETIQLYRGSKAPEEIRKNLGIVQAVIRRPARRPGKEGALKFKAIGRQPRSKLVSVRKGRIYHTRVGSGTVLSSEPLGTVRKA